MRFSKYSGAGNDFILIDNRSRMFNPALTSSLCHRQEGIGADGIICLDSLEKNIFCMRIFNADGSEAEMCGNGIRCFTKFLRELGFIQDFYLIQNIEDKIYTTSFSSENQLTVEMALVTNLKFNQTCSVLEKSLMIHSLNTGVPHAVTMVSDLETIDVENLGRALRFHKDFQPQGTNANFINIDQENIVHLRTYERGVENETLACGTGACAAAIVACKLVKLSCPISVKVRSQDILTINFQIEGENIVNLTMTGPAKKIFEGSF